MLPSETSCTYGGKMDSREQQDQRDLCIIIVIFYIAPLYKLKVALQNRKHDSRQKKNTDKHEIHGMK